MSRPPIRKPTSFGSLVEIAADIAACSFLATIVVLGLIALLPRASIDHVTDLAPKIVGMRAGALHLDPAPTHNADVRP